MRPSSFEYLRPGSIAEAVGALGDGAMVLAGGQSLMPVIKLRRSNPQRLVDINRIAELGGVSVGDAGDITIGAMTRHQEVVDNPVVRDLTPLLSAAAGKIADYQVRSRGTIGGNVCHADPRANLSSVLIALDATAVVMSRDGSRTVPVASLFAGARRTALPVGCLLTQFVVPAPRASQRSAYLEVAPQQNGVPIVNVAVYADEGTGAPRIAIGGLRATPCRAAQVERAVQESGPTREVIESGISQLLAAGDQFEDTRGPREYRAHLAAVLIERALRSVLEPLKKASDR